MLIMVNLPITDYFIGLTAGTSSAPTACVLSGPLCAIFRAIPIPTADYPLIIAIGANNFDSLAANKALLTGFFSLTTNLTNLYPVMNLLDKYALIMVLQFVLVPVDLVLGIILVQTIARSLGGALKLSIGKRIRIA